MKKALVTLLLGRDFHERWKRNCFDGWRKYAQRHGYDLIFITQPLDSSSAAKKRSMAWQKCLIFRSPEVSACDRVVWLDADIMISDSAPCIVGQVPEDDRVGAVELFSHLESGTGQEDLRNRAKLDAGMIARSAEEMYSYAHLQPFPKLVQTGVMVLSPKWHQQSFEKVYEDGTEFSPFYEMLFLSAELMTRDNVQWIDSRFNDTIMEVLLKHYPFFLASDSLTPSSLKLKKFILRKLFLRMCIDAALRNTWFLHFAGYGKYLEAVNYFGKWTKAG